VSISLMGTDGLTYTVCQLELTRSELDCYRNYKTRPDNHNTGSYKINTDVINRVAFKTNNHVKYGLR
jgi:hypothetical protein